MIEMPKYIIELKSDSCFDCPMCQYGLSDDCDMCPDHDWIEDKSTRPEWCPLIPVEQYEIAEYVKSVNSQPEKDDELWDMRVELYKSEWQKLMDIGFRNGLSVSKQIAQWVDDAI